MVLIGVSMTTPVDISPIVDKFEEFFSSKKYKKEFGIIKSLYPSKRSFYFSYKDFEKFDPDWRID